MIRKLITTIIFIFGLLACYGQEGVKYKDIVQGETRTYVSITTDSLLIDGTQECRIKLKNLDTKTVMLDTNTTLPLHIPIADKSTGKYLLLINIGDIQHFYTILIQH